jgi:hypothetical protein
VMLSSKSVFIFVIRSPKFTKVAGVSYSRNWRALGPKPRNYYRNGYIVTRIEMAAITS